MGTPASDAISDPNVALCFDTCAIYGATESTELLRGIRDRYTKRRLLIPSYVVAERARQLKHRYGRQYNPQVIRAWLIQPELAIRVVSFTANNALNAWTVVTESCAERWSWKGTPLPGEKEDRPCAERCRTGDYIVYAIARAFEALLVTGDRHLLEQANRDGYRPGAVDTGRLQRHLAGE